MGRNIQQELDHSYILGCTKYKDEYIFFLMPVIYWVLNVASYDPGTIDNTEYVFRDNVLNVPSGQEEAFFKAIDEFKLDPDSVNLKKYNPDILLQFYIDFDSKLYISYFDDIILEEYVPDNTWTGKFDNALKYLPKEQIKRIFPD